MEPRITSSLQNKSIEYSCSILANIFYISNDGLDVFEMKIIPTIEGFVCDDVVIIHNGRDDFAMTAKIKSQYLMLRPRLLHRIIAHNILPKMGIMMRLL